MLFAALLVAAPVQVLAAPLPAGVPVIAIDGRGFGHGVGLPQDGALAMGQARAGLEAIMARFYPGTKWAKATGAVRVGVAEAGGASGSFTLAFPSGGEIRNGRDGSTAPFPLRVGRGGQVAVSFDGATYRARVLNAGSALARRARRARRRVRAPWKLAAATAEPTTTMGLLPTTSSTIAVAPGSPPPTTTTTGAPGPASTTSTTAHGTAPASGQPASTAPLWAVPGAGATTAVLERAREYRGVLEAISAAGGFRIVNEVDAEDYLRGMGEVRNPSWPAASLEAQAVAARTYALRAARAGLRPEGFSLYDDDRSQVYIGRSAEYPAMDKAVSRTKGRVLVFGGGLAATVYSASAGGITATAPEGFGPKAPDRPYLGVTRYDTPDPHAWHVEVLPSDVAARLGYPGVPTVIAVRDRGPSGRPLHVTLEGPAGSLTVDATTFASALGLRSTLFELGFSTANAPPPPPPAPTALQQLPEGGTVTEAAAPETAAETWPFPFLTAAYPLPHRDGRGQRGPLPPAAATALLLLVTWGLLMRRSPTAAALGRQAWSLTGRRALTHLEEWRRARRTPPFGI